MATVLRRLKLKRVSLVDSPANEEARVVLFKSADYPEGAMVACKTCGKKVAKDATKCPYCGASMVSKVEDDRHKEGGMDADKLKADLDAANAKLEEANAKLAEANTKIEGLQKQLDTPEAIEKRRLEALPESIRKRIEEGEAKIAKLESERSEGELAAIVKADMPQIPGKPEENGKLLKRVRDVVSKEDFDALVTMLKAASAQIEKGELFREVGKGGDGKPAAGDPMARINQLADELVAKDANLKRQDAVARVIEQHPELYGSYSKSVMATAVPRSHADADAD